jgi:hypothetical protein
LQHYAWLGYAVGVQKLWEDTDRVIEAGFVPYVVLGDVVLANDLSGFPHAHT